MTPAALVAIVPGPWGPIHLAATARGIVAIDLLTPTEAFVANLERRLRGVVSTEIGPPGSEGHLEAGRRALSRFLAGEPDAFAGLPLDLEDRPAWDRAVLGAVRQIGRGETSSYGRIARAVGRPGAARAVGGAVGRNPISLAIPCHRIIAGDGGLGGYGGGWWGSREVRLDLKRDLLAREGVSVREERSGAHRCR